MEKNGIYNFYLPPPPHIKTSSHTRTKKRERQRDRTIYNLQTDFNILLHYLLFALAKRDFHTDSAQTTPTNSMFSFVLRRKIIATNPKIQKKK